MRSQIERMKNLLCTAAVLLAIGPSALAQDKAPAEADLYMHRKDAFTNSVVAPGLPRVLLIGDSISIGYTAPVRKQLQGTANVFRPAANCQHTGYGLAQLKSWLGTNHWDVIHFNWGIWDTHMLDANGGLVRDEANAAGPLHIRYSPAQYGTNLSRLVDILQGTGAKLIWASTTPIMYRTGARFEDIPIRNAIAAEIMNARKIPIDDLYEYTLPHAKEWQGGDQVHFSAVGNERLAERVCESILRELPAQPAAAAPEPGGR